MTSAEVTQSNIQPDSSVQVTLQLPSEIYQWANQTANSEHRQLEDFLCQLVVKSLQADENYKLWKSISDRYIQRLEHEGKLEQTPEEILYELSITREKVANELFPE